MFEADLKKVMIQLKSLNKKITSLNPNNPVHRKLAPKYVNAYLFFVETIIGHKKKTKEMIEWINKGKLTANKKKALSYLILFRGYWHKLMPEANKDPAFKTRDWQTKHAYDQETIQTFFYNLIDFSNVNEGKIENRQWNYIDVNHFIEYLNRCKVLEEDYKVSALNFGRK